MRRLTFWKLDRLEKEKSLASEHFLEEQLSEETADMPEINVVFNVHIKDVNGRSQGGRKHWDVYHTSPQNLIITFSSCLNNLGKFY